MPRMFENIQTGKNCIQSEQRDARLEHMKTLQQQRLEVETPQERDT